ncbi:phospholipid scramblase 2-like isoform X2 [Hyaena hyaena]|uniref:phospholipid scramblase 2-like isoform X2 n=1 Tax=Hyaena hyaena TaxID=95912 RepID=UPI001922D39A|nr:phospholipid scramblase 2-like isoform X2 [Hyaena hyaena]
MSFCNLQPTVQWMQTPGTIPNCPPGLEYLTQINQLLVCQRFDLLEEDRSNCFLRYLCGPSRPFTMTIYDNVGRDVITIQRTLRSRCCWRNCSVQKLKVEAPPGEKIGYVYQYFHPFLPMFEIKNENKEDIMKIRGPCVVSSCLKDLNFNLLSLDEEIVLGKISKKWAGFMITNADKFGIQFPFNLDVKIKALMLGASFLIDYMYFEVWP